MSEKLPQADIFQRSAVILAPASLAARRHQMQCCQRTREPVQYGRRSSPETRHMCWHKLSVSGLSLGVEERDHRVTFGVDLPDARHERGTHTRVEWTNDFAHERFTALIRFRCGGVASDSPDRVFGKEVVRAPVPSRHASKLREIRARLLFSSVEGREVACAGKAALAKMRLAAETSRRIF